MMNRIHRPTLLFLMGSVLGSAPALAHHSFAAEFDRKQPLTLNGVVTRLEWENPHTRLYITVSQASGTIDNWELELASPNALMRSGWTRHSVKVGDKITVKGFRAKDGSPLVNASTIISAEGKQILSEQTSADAPAPN
jgi:Family of unknown function (DUF6152)